MYPPTINNTIAAETPQLSGRLTTDRLEWTMG
jgi:hypothetical protein